MSPSRGAAVAIPVQQGTDAWRDERRFGIGSSDAPATVDLDPFKSRLELWAIKRGLIEEGPETDTMRIGKLVEPVASTLYELQTGRKLRRRLQMLSHPDYPFLRASLDRVSGQRIIELKKSRTGLGYGRRGTDQVPPHVLIQVQHQLLVTGYPVADVAVFVAGEDLRRYEIPADRGLQDALLAKEIAFWDCVLIDTPPTDLDGSEATRRYVTARYPEDGGHQMIPDEEFSALALQLAGARAGAAVAAEEQQRLENQIKARMGAAALAEGPGYRITWKNNRPSVTTDWEAVARDVASTSDALDAAIDIHTSETPGKRVLRPTFTKESTDA